MTMERVRDIIRKLPNQSKSYLRMMEEDILSEDEAKMKILKRVNSTFLIEIRYRHLAGEDLSGNDLGAADIFIVGHGDEVVVEEPDFTRFMQGSDCLSDETVAKLSRLLSI